MKAPHFLLGSIGFVTAVVSAILILGWFTGILPMFIEGRSRVRNGPYHDELYKTSIRPKAEWVKAFYAEHQRFPTQQELNPPLSLNTNIVFVIDTNAFRSKPAWPNPGRDFILSASAGDWNLYLQSWDGKEYKYWTD